MSKILRGANPFPTECLKILALVSSPLVGSCFRKGIGIAKFLFWWSLMNNKRTKFDT